MHALVTGPVDGPLVVPLGQLLCRPHRTCGIGYDVVCMEVLGPGAVPFSRQTVTGGTHGKMTHSMARNHDVMKPST